MVSMIYSGARPYNGSDPETGASVRVVTDQKVLVSEAKSKQLLKDFPKDWKIATAALAQEVTHEDGKTNPAPLAPVVEAAAPAAQAAEPPAPATAPKPKAKKKAGRK